MIEIRKAQARGHSQLDWLNSYHTFSFAEYYDPNYPGFSDLRVINEDFISPKGGFARHPHKNMEIITYVVEGALEHRDSLGTGSVIKPGEIQRMSAGTGILHSEFNHSDQQQLHLLQIWILPAMKNMRPSYEQKKINKHPNQLLLIASPEQKEDAVTIQQDVDLYVAYLTKTKHVLYDFKPRRCAWLQLIKGKIEVNGTLLNCGDGASIQDEEHLKITCLESAEFLLFDVKCPIKSSS